jgi:hypothetical protein
MADTTKVEKAARKLCTHTVCFTDAQSRRIAILALQGMTTRAIADELRISTAVAQYAILKAQRSLGVRFRHDYRNGNSRLARQMMHSTENLARHFVSRSIAPKFIPFAAPGVSRIAG